MKAAEPPTLDRTSASAESEIKAEVVRIVAALIAEGATAPPSRNRNFADYDDEVRGAAYRLHGRLLNVQQELLRVQRAGQSPNVTSDVEGTRILAYELDVPQGPLHRRARFLPAEWELLSALCDALDPNLLPS